MHSAVQFWYTICYTSLQQLFDVVGPHVYMNEVAQLR